MKVIQIRRILFRRVMDEYPELAYLMQDRVAARLARLVDDLEQVRAKLGSDDYEAMSLEDVNAFVERK